MMIVEDFIWLRDIIDKLDAKHNVTTLEVEEVFDNRPHYRFISKGRQQRGEDVYAAYGQTEEGRYLTVFFIYKTGNMALIISARDMDDKERKRYVRS